jgi:hypothetical protein
MNFKGRTSFIIQKFSKHFRYMRMKEGTYKYNVFSIENDYKWA